MLSKSILSAAILATSLVAATPLTVRDETPFPVDCGSVRPTEEFLQLSREMEANQTESLVEAAAAKINVKVYFHVVAGAKTEAEGWVSDKQITDQIAVMNKAFAPHNIHFDKVGTTREVNKVWTWRPAQAEKDKMTKKLRKGQYKDLNIYVQKGVGNQGVAGYCFYPTKGVQQNSPPHWDGCFVNSDTLPRPGQLGFVSVHEVGHWFGLQHTFEEAENGKQPSCDGNTGDMVDDTPIHLQSSVSVQDCNNNKAVNTCPGKPGNDPITNYMNYVPMGCMKKFTPGQEKRMVNMWNTLRNVK